MLYDPAPFADAQQEFVWCAVTATVRATGETRETVGDYLNLEGTPALHCGVEEMASNLDLLPLLEDDDHYLVVCRAVTRQLAWRPFALITCPMLSARIELVEPI